MDCKDTAFFACEQVGEREIYLKLRKKCYFLRIVECYTRKIERFIQIKHHLYLSSMSIFTHCIYAHMSVSIFTHWSLVVKVQKKEAGFFGKKNQQRFMPSLLYKAHARQFSYSRQRGLFPVHGLPFLS